MEQTPVKRGPKESEFMRLVFAHDRRIYTFIYTLVCKHNDAEDIFQDTLVVMWNKFDAFEDGGDFGSWGVGIAHNLVRNFRKKNARSRQIFTDEMEQVLAFQAQQAVERIDDRIDALRQCLKRVNYDDLRITLLRYEQRMSVKQIAERIGQNVQRVYAALARTNDRLLRCIRRVTAEQEIV